MTLLPSFRMMRSPTSCKTTTDEERCRQPEGYEWHLEILIREIQQTLSTSLCAEGIVKVSVRHPSSGWIRGMYASKND